MPMFFDILYLVFVAVFLLFAMFTFVYAFLALYSSLMGSPYVPTKNKEIENFLKEARLKKGQNFTDLGCGDGRVVQIAVEKYGVNGWGVDINPILIAYARFTSRKLRNIRFTVENILKSDVSNSDIIYVFLLPGFLDKLALKIKKEAKKGTVVISHGFRIDIFKNKLFKTIPHLPFPTYFYRL